jgi:broad specificity phosphatase PhoE
VKTTLYLIRHGTNDFVGKTLVGRMPGVHLNEAGWEQANVLADRLQNEPIHQIFSSPLERCRETAAPIAAARQLEVQVLDALTEVEFGTWTGLDFASLEGVELWKQWNAFRTGVRIPNGETILEVQGRMLGAIDALRRSFAGQGIAIVSHGDPLRAAICFWLGMPLDFIQRVEISPASVSVVEIDDWGLKVRCLNAQWNSALQL